MSVSLIALGELVTFLGGGTPDRSNPAYWYGEIPWATVKDLKSGELSDTQEYITREGLENSASTIIDTGTVIMATRMGLGKVAINTIPMSINQDLKGVVCSSRIAPRYLLHFLLSKASMLELAGHGATVKGIKLDYLRSMKIPLPPLDEQRRIAAILDRADAIRRKRAEAVGLAHKMAQNVFISMFGHPGRNEKEYPRKGIGDLCQRCSSMNPAVGKQADDTFRYIELGSVDGKLGRIVGISEFIGKDAPSRARQIIRAGDVLVSTVRPNLRGTALADMSYDGNLGSTGFCVLRPGKELSSNYLYQITRFPWFSEQLAMKVRGANYPAVTDKDVLSVTIPVPPLALLQRYDSLASRIADLTVVQERYLRETDNLFSSLQQCLLTGGNANA